MTDNENMNTEHTEHRCVAGMGTPLLLTLGAFYGIGVFASLVLGKKLLGAFEAMLGRMPLVQTIYGGTKRFLQSLRKPPVSG